MSSRFVNLYDYESAAQELLPKAVWDFIAGGAGDELTMRRNRSAFDALALRPRFVRRLGERDLRTTVLGTEISLPLFLSPCGQHGLAHADGELATAEGAALSGTVMGVGTYSTRTLEEVREASSGPLWFQLYHSSRDETERLIRRAEESSCAAVCITIDVPLRGGQERDTRNAYPQAREGRGPLPGWPLDWSDVEWIRSLTSLPLALKGIRTAEDALLAVEHGIEGVFVSTHGGRHLDGTQGAIEVLPEIVEAVGERAEVIMDSGVRRGSDVLKALALGARAVGIGRPLFWGLAVDGAHGVHDVIEILRHELDAVMGLCGQNSVHELDSGLLAPASR